MSFKSKERRMSTTLQIEDKESSTPRRSSVLSIQPLEDIVSCPIHLGILENPRQLPCAHAFCLDCLVTYYSAAQQRQCTDHLTNLVCPVCRYDCPLPKDGPAAWPPAFTHTHVLEFVKEQRVKRYARSTAAANEEQGSDGKSPTSAVRKGSIFGKADLLKTLAEELASKQGQAGTDDKAIVINELNSLLSRLQSQEESEIVHIKLEDACNSSTTVGNIDNHRGLDPTAPPMPMPKRGSYETQCDVEGIRHSMRYLCEYRVKREPQNYAASGGNRLSNSSELSIKRNSGTSLSSTDVALSLTDRPCIDIDLNPSNRRHVFATADGHIVCYHGSSNSTCRFKPKVETGVFFAVHLRVVTDAIFLSGLWERDSAASKVGILFRCDFEGNILARSNEYPVDSADYLPVQGFDINLVAQEIYVTKPSKREITVFTMSLEETDRHWIFHDPPLNPSYVCRFETEGEIWATCPNQESIMILYEANGRYSHFGTDKIFGSAPSHIICTTDNRVCFLDDRQSRVFWIQKRHDFLCIQRLSFGGCLRNSQIRLLQPLADNRILITDEKRIFTAKPKKELDKNSKCTVL